jgi:hypothetical protein
LIDGGSTDEYTCIESPYSLSMFSVLSEANKVERRAEKIKLLEEQKALEEPVKPESVPVIDEVKGRSWADVDSDDETPHAGGADVPDDTSSEEGEPEEEEAEENQAPETASVVSESKSNEPKPEAAVKQLSKKEKAALKKQELDDLDDVLAEFGVEVSAPTTQQETKKKKKKKDENNTTPELSEVEKASPSPEPSEPESKAEASAVDENAKEEALKKLAAKGKGKGKGGAKTDKKSGISTAAEEAKKRAKNVAKPKRDKNAFDR